MNRDADITVSMSVANPGHFLAACGLLEMADRFWPGAEGFFDSDRFRILCGGSLPLLLNGFADSSVKELLELPNGLSVKPLIAPLLISFQSPSVCSIQLDGWMSIDVEKGKPVTVANRPWNFWSGQQTARRIWDSLMSEFRHQIAALSENDFQNVFNLSLPLKGRFGFDPGPAWNALDAGFSPNEQDIPVATSAIVELLAAVGLQRFRPWVSPDRESFVYCTWSEPLSPIVAVAAMAGVLPSVRRCRYRAAIVSRGSYAALGHAIQLRGGEDGRPVEV
jgi:CRISPR-associated protein Csb3